VPLFFIDLTTDPLNLPLVSPLGFLDSANSIGVLTFGSKGYNMAPLSSVRDF
jgi:hypothetical protein